MDVLCLSQTANSEDERLAQLCSYSLSSLSFFSLLSLLSLSSLFLLSFFSLSSLPPLSSLSFSLFSLFSPFSLCSLCSLRSFSVLPGLSLSLSLSLSPKRPSVDGRTTFSLRGSEEFASNGLSPFTDAHLKGFLLSLLKDEMKTLLNICSCRNIFCTY